MLAVHQLGINAYRITLAIFTANIWKGLLGNKHKVKVKQSRSNRYITYTEIQV